MEQKKEFDEIMADNFPYLVKDINLKSLSKSQTEKLKEIYAQMYHNQTAEN